LTFDELTKSIQSIMEQIGNAAELGGGQLKNLNQLPIGEQVAVLKTTCERMRKMPTDEDMSE
jgi:hypothetical protein